MVIQQSKKVDLERIDKREQLGPFVTLKGAAQALDVPENWILRAIRQKKVRARRLGWIWIIHQEKLQGLLDSV